MNNNSMVNFFFKFAQVIRLGFQISKQSSKAYRIVSLLITLSVFAMNWTILQSVIKTHHEINPLIVKCLVESIFFVAVCHYFIRSYLKLFILNRPITVALCLKLLVYLAVLSVLSLAALLAFAHIDYFEHLDMSSVQFSNDEGTMNASITPTLLWVLGSFQQFSNFFLWVIFYLFWHGYQSKKQLQQQMHQAQIQQLTNQLSPHFLFNTFNSIRALIYEDQDKAADTVTQLADLFRTHLQAHLRANATLREEWQVCQRYLAIEQVRLEDRLNVTINVDDDVWQQTLPTLTLLTLVENAIKHGISPNSDIGFINIKANLLNTKQWQVVISNSVGNAASTESTKTGLKNIETRLSLMFANQATITTELKDNTFTVTLVLPYV